MLVSVIMPVYNGIRFLQRSIDSILNQSYPYLEFIIVDDGSTEPVWDLIKSYNDERIIAFRNTENLGIAKSLNICLDRVRGDFIVKHDSDDVSFPHRIKKQLTYFEEGVGFVGCWAASLNENGNPIRHFVDIHCRCSDEDLKTRYSDFLCMADPTSLYSKEAVQKVGYFDERLSVAETYNYNRRIQQFFKGRVAQEVLYFRTVRHDSIMRTIKIPVNVDMQVLANQYAKIKPIIKERQHYSWETE